MLELRKLFASAITAWRTAIRFMWVIPLVIEFINQPFLQHCFALLRIRALSECTVHSGCTDRSLLLPFSDRTAENIGEFVLTALHGFGYQLFDDSYIFQWPNIYWRVKCVHTVQTAILPLEVYHAGIWIIIVLRFMDSYAHRAIRISYPYTVKLFMIPGHYANSIYHCTIHWTSISTYFAIMWTVPLTWSMFTQTGLAVNSVLWSSSYSTKCAYNSSRKWSDRISWACKKIRSTMLILGGKRPLASFGWYWVT